MPDTLKGAMSAISAHFELLNERIFSQGAIRTIFTQNRKQWKVPSSTTFVGGSFLGFAFSPDWGKAVIALEVAQGAKRFFYAPSSPAAETDSGGAVPIVGGLV